jgi:hypothetical protein
VRLVYRRKIFFAFLARCKNKDRTKSVSRKGAKDAKGEFIKTRGAL